MNLVPPRRTLDREPHRVIGDKPKALSFDLYVDEEKVGEFGSVEGLSGELYKIGEVTGPFLSLADGRFLGDLARAPTSRKLRKRVLGNGELRLGTSRSAFTSGIYVGPLALLMTSVDASGVVREAVFEVPDLDPTPQHTVEEWESWGLEPPTVRARWTGMSTARKQALLLVTCLAHTPNSERRALPPQLTVEGNTIRDHPSLFLALGEAFDGVGGYLGRSLDGLADRLIDFDQNPEGCTVLWTHSRATKVALSGEWRRRAWRNAVDVPSDACLLSATFEVLQERGFTVVEG